MTTLCCMVVIFLASHNVNTSAAIASTFEGSNSYRI